VAREQKLRSLVGTGSHRQFDLHGVIVK
jgi:hypothetical protein